MSRDDIANKFAIIRRQTSRCYWNDLKVLEDLAQGSDQCDDTEDVERVIRIAIHLSEMDQKALSLESALNRSRDEADQRAFHERLWSELR